MCVKSTVGSFLSAYLQKRTQRAGGNPSRPAGGHHPSSICSFVSEEKRGEVQNDLQQATSVRVYPSVRNRLH